MKRWNILQILLLLLISFAGANLNAQVGSVTSLLSRDLPGFPGKEGRMVQVDFAPGEVVPTHHHNADVFVYVL
jgi:quercetin dioxygenase-like cupin family protein